MSWETDDIVRNMAAAQETRMNKIPSAKEMRGQIQMLNSVTAQKLLEKVLVAMNGWRELDQVLTVETQEANQGVISSAKKELEALGYIVEFQPEKHSNDPREPGLLSRNRLHIRLPQERGE